MAKIFEGAIKLASTIQQTGAQPLDDRVVVATVNDLYDSFGTAIYNGMLVAVAETGDVYMLKDKTKVGEAAGWKIIGGDTAADLTKVKGDVAANKAAIDVINGTDDGSFAKGDADTLAAAKQYTDNAKTDLIGDATTADTIKHAEKLATDASKKVDTEIGKLDVAGNISEAVKGVTVTVDETDGKVIKPVVSIADGTLTGEATDGNLVTGTVVKKYVDNKVSDINTSANALSSRVDTLEDKVGSKAVEGGAAATGLFKEIADEASTARAAEKKNADAIAAEITRATAAEEKVKTDLIGDAAAEYNTLGKLEDKIQAEALRADTAEKANAAAAAAAQEAANAKVKSVEGTNTVAATTTDHAVSVSLKTSDKGNVKFTQDTDGLSANVTIPEATVTGVKADDKFLSLADKLVSADVSIAYDADDKKIYLYGKDKTKANAVSSIDCTDFIKDGMLDSASLVTNPEGQDAGTYIKLTWNTDGGKQPMYINVTSLIDIYTAKSDGGLVLEDHAFSVDTTKIATVESVNGVTDRVSTLEGKVATIEGEGEGSIKKAVADEASRAKAAEEANAAAIATEKTRATEAEAALLGTDGDAATKDTIKGAKQAVKDLEAQIKADAVTLTIPDDDPYITASKDATTNKYTIKSKLDADGTTPLVDVKINTKLTEKINSLDVTGNKSEAVAGIAVTVNETDGIVSKPIVAVTPGSIAADDASVVTGGAVYTAINDALVWHDIA